MTGPLGRMTGPLGRATDSLDGVTEPLDRWRLGLYTAANMEPVQLAGIAERKLRHAVIPSLPIDFDWRYERRIPDDLPVDAGPLRANNAALRESLTADERARCRERVESVRRGEVEFLNRTLTFENPEAPAWDHERLDELPGLWRLKLHGFVPLSWAVRGYEESRPALDSLFEAWVRDWADSHPVGTEGYLRRSWTPYAVSLRLVNWCRYLAWRTRRESVDDSLALRRAIYKHALFLRNHVERDVGGNHLVENGAALVVAGSLFPGRGRAWLDHGAAILRDAAETQFLDDGAHFERSPMYHLSMVECYLTAVDLLDTVGHPVPDAVRETAAAARRFVAAIRSPDGQIPLLNDSVYGEAFSIQAALDFAERVGVGGGGGGVSVGGGGGVGGGGPRREPTARQRSHALSAETDGELSSSGYYWLGTGDDRLLVDGGPPGPDHLPGHSHNDFLQVLLWVDGRRLVTDTGVYHYAPDDRRQSARSVRSHNTIQVADAEPVEIGGRYLMGRRTRPAVSYRADDRGTAFDGRYEVRSGLGRAYAHRRRIFHRPTWWLVWDDVELADPATTHSRLHLAPEVEVERGGDRFEITAGDATCWIHALNADEVRLETSSYYPEFGVERSRPMLDLRARGSDSVHTGFLVSTESHDEVRLDWTRDRLDGLCLDGEYQRVPTAEESSEA